MSLPDNLSHSPPDHQHQELEILLPGGLYNFPEFASTAPVFSSNSQGVLNSVTGNQESMDWNDLASDVIVALESGMLLEQVRSPRNPRPHLLITVIL
jgi:hypothetical protein